MRELPKLPALAIAYAVVFAGALLMASGDRFGYLMGIAATSIAFIVAEAVEGRDGR